MPRAKKSNPENDALAEDVDAAGAVIDASNVKKGKSGTKRKAEDTSEPAPKKSKKSKDASSSQDAADKPGSLFDIQLDGDDDESVPIFDSCDEVRKKMNKHLRGSKITNAAFMREIARAGWPSSPPNIQSKQLSDFLTKKGATAGSTSRVFYGGYVYFEKMRIFEGKPKSAHRKSMEDQWGARGLPRERERGYWAPQGATVTQDRLGRVRVV